MVIGSLILSLATGSYAQANVTPAQYLASQPKPNFAPGHHLPHLTRWGWILSTNAGIELADNWGYCLEFGAYATPAAASAITNSGTFEHMMVQLASDNPSKYKLSVLIDRTFPYPTPNEFWTTNSAGLFVDDNGNTFDDVIYTNGAYVCATNNSHWPTNALDVSPEGPDSYWTNATEYWMHSLRVIQSNAPITTILNGGEYGLNCAGWSKPAWQQDPRVQVQAVMTNTWTTSNTNGMSWPRYSSDRKAHTLGFLTTAIKQTFPNRELYIFYNTGNEQNRYTALSHWFDIYANWGWNSDVMVTNTDLPSFEDYYGYGGWISITNPFPNDILTRHLNAVGYNIGLGYPRNYSWVCGGWSATDTNALSDIPRYTGFLKCLYTAGMNGAVAGYFSYPTGTNGTLLGGPGFDAAFPSNSPPHWLQQIMALSHVHALFSHLETFTDNSDLLSGPQHHAMSYDQPAYEFTNTVADATARVLVRKLRTSNQWIVTAWNAYGTNRNVTVTIPTIGALTVLAADSGSVYQVTMTGTNVTQTLLDEYGSFPPPIILADAAKLPNGAFQFAFTNTPVGTNYITTNITTTLTTNWSKWGPPKITGYTTNITTTLTTNGSANTATVLTTTNLLLPLTNWTVLGTVTDNPPGQFQFTDPQATNHPLRFYRVRSP
jgi:hypothetical protein